MSAVIISDSGRVRTAAFTDDLADPPRSYLAAAVYWRVSQEEANRPPVDLDPELSTLMREAMDAGPERAAALRSAIEAHLRRRAHERHARLLSEPHVDRGDWSASGEGRTRVECYHKRFVRALGRDYPLPPVGQTLVLLIDEDVDAGAAPRITVHSLELPVVPLPDELTSRDPTQSPPNPVHSQWTAALTAFPAVRDISRDSRSSSRS